MATKLTRKTLDDSVAATVAQNGSASVADRAMLVRLSVEQWTGRKKDKKVTAEALTQHRASASAGSFSKNILDPNAMNDIARVAQSARLYHYQMTLTWMDDGWRMLPSSVYMKYLDEMETYKTSFEIEVEAFLSNYDAYVAKEVGRLGGMFNPEEYPSVEEIKNKFKFSVAFQPVPVANDFRVNLSADIVERLRKEITEATASTVEAAVKDVWQRLYDHTEKLVEQVKSIDSEIGGKNGGIRSGWVRPPTIHALQSLIELLPSLNITEDPALDEMGKALSGMLDGKTPDVFKEDQMGRNEFVDKTNDIMNKMRAFIA